MTNATLALTLLVAGSAAAQSEAEQLDPMTPFDGGNVALLAEGGSSLGQGFGGVSLEARAASQLAYVQAELKMGFAAFKLENIYLGGAARIGIWFPVGPILLAPYVGIVVDTPPGSAAKPAFDAGGTLVLPLHRRFVLEATPRIFGTYQGFDAWVVEGRGIWRYSNYVDLAGGIRYEKLNRGANQPDTVFTVFVGLTR